MAILDLDVIILCIKCNQHDEFYNKRIYTIFRECRLKEIFILSCSYKSEEGK